LGQSRASAFTEKSLRTEFGAKQSRCIDQKVPQNRIWVKADGFSLTEKIPRTIFGAKQGRCIHQKVPQNRIQVKAVLLLLPKRVHELNLGQSRYPFF